MPTLTKEMVPGLISNGGTCRVDKDVPANFSVGDAVEIKNIHPAHHTRLPRYIRGKEGIINRDHGVFVFPDTNANGKGEKPQHVYSVKFSFQELWGEDQIDNMYLYIDMFDDYMLKPS